MCEREEVLEMALHSIFVYRPSFANAIRAEYDNLIDFFTLPDNVLSSISGINEEHISKIKSEKFIENCAIELDWCREKGISVVRHKDFPIQLKEICDSPLLLFCKGDINLFNVEYSLSIVGTRLATNYGKQACNGIVEFLASSIYKPVIYSGLAYGIDACAHKLAMQNGLKTVAVLPNGLDMIYPSNHRELAREIISNRGLLITEFTKGMMPVRQNFIRRNRLIAAVSNAVIIAESRVKGGAMLTAEYANNYGREVFAVPGRMIDVNSYGCNYLISKNIAHILNTPAKIPEILSWKHCNISESTEINAQPELFSTDNAIKNKILSLLNAKSAILIDYICSVTSESLADISAALVELELEGMVVNTANGYLLNN